MHNPRPWEIVGGRNERAKRIFAEEYAWRTRIREEERGGSTNGSGRKMERKGTREDPFGPASNAHVRNGVPRSRKVEGNEKL